MSPEMFRRRAMLAPEQFSAAAETLSEDRISNAAATTAFSPCPQERLTQ
jgi:hypothetical protein